MENMAHSFAPFDNEGFKDVLKLIDVEKVEGSAEDRANEVILLKAKNKFEEVKNEILNKTWQQQDESNFRIRAREVANRLHGVYNVQDKTLL